MQSLSATFVAPSPLCSNHSSSTYSCNSLTLGRRGCHLRSCPFAPNRRRALGTVCMAEPYLITKLESAEKTWKELSVKLADPDVVSNPSEYQKLAQSMSDLDGVVSTYRNFKDIENQLEEARALAKEEGDDDMAEMIEVEVESLTKQMKGLEEQLKMLLLPSDPLDARNILLEVRAGTGGDEAGIWAGDLVDEWNNCIIN